MDSASGIDGRGLRVHGGLTSIPIAVVAIALVALYAAATVVAADNGRTVASSDGGRRRRGVGAVKVLDPERLRSQVLAAGGGE